MSKLKKKNLDKLSDKDKEMSNTVSIDTLFFFIHFWRAIFNPKNFKAAETTFINF